ncbi:hypothetical protein GPECTOR_79g101 [Gonium pectorale]|uniref:Uncharacterized protein n=1 Tax=Gonium pectorale TaxID=33097 RepID=A0A150G1S7_GONPE|nr:hypothetical protein GPECTOR_79g101 [Gonium pectorale]|eukprot:KXZ43822.1 hypothetical protein GPECTOR_79g101 [Gonium pectorale]
MDTAGRLNFLEEQNTALFLENIKLEGMAAQRARDAYEDGRRDENTLLHTQLLNMRLQQQQQLRGPSASPATYAMSDGTWVNASVHFAGGTGGLGSGPQHPVNDATMHSPPYTTGNFAAGAMSGAASRLVNTQIGFHDALSASDPQVLPPWRSGLGATVHPSYNMAPFMQSAAASAGGFAPHPATYPTAGGPHGGMGQPQLATQIVPGAATQPRHGSYQESAAFYGGPPLMHHGPSMPPSASLRIRQTGVFPPSLAGGGQQQGSAPSGGRRSNARSDGSGSIMRDNDGTRQRSSPSGPGDFGGGGSHY